MGQLFQSAGLTVPNSALIGPGGQPTFMGSPQQVLAKANSGLPSTDQIIGGSDVLHPQVNQNALDALPKIGTPSFQQAANSGPAGMPNAMSPELTKAGKLATLLLSGLQGALAGRAKSEETVAATGGRRSGGVGMGVQAGYQLPFTHAMMPLELAQQRAETGLAQAGLQPVDTPYGQMPAALASKILTPYLGYQGRVQAAQIGGQSREAAAQAQAGSRVQAAEIGKRYIPVPGVGLYDTQSRSLLPGSEQGITVTPEIAQDYQLPQQFIGKPMTLQNLAAVQRSSVFENTPMMTAEGPIVANRRTGQAQPIQGPGGQRYGPTSLASPKEVADPDNPGQTVIVPAGQSFGKAGAQSASVQVPKAAARAEVPTKIGDQKVAFNTAKQHADLLDEAAKALHNGDWQTLNRLQNSFTNEFGATGPITATVIANAYGREINKMLSANHMTNSEIATIGATVDPDQQNYAQVHKVLKAYKALAQSKLNMLNQQKQSAINQSQKTGNAPLKIIRDQNGRITGIQ